MGGSRGWGGGNGSRPHLENHKLLYVSLEILVRTPLEKQLDTWCPIAFQGRPVQPSVRYVRFQERPANSTFFLDPRMTVKALLTLSGFTGFSKS